MFILLSLFLTVSNYPEFAIHRPFSAAEQRIFLTALKFRIALFLAKTE